MENCYTVIEDKIHLAVKAVPGSSKNQICDVKGNAQEKQRLKIKIAAPAEDGKANEELRSFLAKKFGCAKKDIQLVAGEKSPLKTISLPLCVLEKLNQQIGI